MGLLEATAAVAPAAAIIAGTWALGRRHDRQLRRLFTEHNNAWHRRHRPAAPGDRSADPRDTFTPADRGVAGTVIAEQAEAQP